MSGQDGYTAAEALAALSILGLAMAGLTTSMTLIAKGQLKARQQLEQSMLERAVDQRLERLLGRDAPFRSDQLDHLVGDERRLEVDCGGPQRCVVRVEDESLIVRDRDVYQLRRLEAWQPEYDYSVATTVSGPLGTKAVYHFNWMHPTFSLGEVSHALYAITDGLNRDWGVNVDGGGLRSVGYPEGNTTTYYRDLITGALTETVSVPKSDSGLSNLSVTLSYPACTGSNAIACRRPTSSTDKRGKVTDYIYDAAGNLVTETAPAPTPGAVRPQTRRTWEQRYAWYKQNGSSAITQATSPIWVLTETSECRTTASCTGAADERKSTITYQVGSSGVASNLLPLTKSVGAGSGSPWNTTTYTYTPLGDVSTVDGPLSGAADKTRTFYDAMRQVVGGVGPDPDGGGSLKYRATRTTYNADGQVTLSETGTTTDQSDTAMSTFQALTFKRNTYDATTGRLIKTEEGQP